MADKFRTQFKIAKVDRDHGIVIGWGMQCDPDVDRERVSGESMLQSVIKFSKQAVLPTDVEHDEIQDGQVLFHFPLTNEFAEALELEIPHEGWIVGCMPSEATLAKIDRGEITGFSVGGTVGGYRPDPTQEAA